jgi:hypothetical protein
MLARRQRQMAARAASAGRLEAALARVLSLEADLAALRVEMERAEQQHKAATEQAAALAAHAAVADCGVPEARMKGVLQDEVAERLSLMAPILVEGLAKAGGAAGGLAATPQLVVSRRNAAGHSFNVAAKLLRGMHVKALNAVQRSRRTARPGRSRLRAAPLHRAAPLLRSAEEAVPGTWTVARARRSSSMPARRGLLFEAADAARRQPPKGNQRFDTARWWPAEAERIGLQNDPAGRRAARGEEGDLDGDPKLLPGQESDGLQEKKKKFSKEEYAEKTSSRRTP